MNHKKERNPLRAERSPRNQFIGYNFSVPEKKYKEPERWNYPATDWGLMSKFSSQQKIYDAIYRKEADYKDKFRELQEIKRENQKKIAEELYKQQHLYDGPGENSNHHHHHQHQQSINKYTENIHDSINDELSEIKRKEEIKNHKKGFKRDIKSKEKKNLEDMDISGFKTLQSKHPEVLAKWRAERAAKFISKCQAQNSEY